MSSKNNPLRSIDQKTTSTTPPPGARPTKFNPYTGGIIKGEEQSRYRVFLDSDEDWVLETFNLIVGGGNTSTDSVSVRIPRLTIRIINQNFSPDKLRVYLAFSKAAFDEDDSVADSLINTDEPNASLKIVSFTTKSVTYVNSTTVSREVSTFIRRLIEKHTMVQLLQLMYEDVTTAEILARTSTQRVKLFYDGLSNLNVFAQVAFIPLNPVNDVDSTPFILRSPATCSYRLTPSQLRNADLSSTKLTIDNKELQFSYEQVAIRSFKYKVVDNTGRVVVNPSLHTVPLVNDVRPRKNTLKIDVTRFIDVAKKFNQSTTALSAGQLSALLDGSFTFTLSLLEVTSIASEVKYGEDITRAYDVDTTYPITYGADVNYTEEITVIPPVLSLINKSRIYKIGVPATGATTGVLFVYKIGSNSYVPRYYALTGAKETIGDRVFYTVEDFFAVGKTTQNTYKQKITGATEVKIYPVNNFGRCSINTVAIKQLNQYVDLSKDLGGTQGYYRQSITVNGQKQLVFSATSGRTNNNLRVELPFRVQILTKKGIYVLTYTSPLYYAKVEFSGNERRVKFVDQKGTVLTAIPLSSHLGSTGYQVRLQPDGTALKAGLGTFIQTGGIVHVGLISGR